MRQQSYLNTTKQTTPTVNPTVTRPLQFEFPLNETIYSGKDYLSGKSGIRTLETGSIRVYSDAIKIDDKIQFRINRATFKGVEITPILKHFGNYADIEDATLNAATSLFNQIGEGQ